MANEDPVPRKRTRPHRVSCSTFKFFYNAQANNCLEEKAAARLQLAWRAHKARRTAPRHVAACYVQRVVDQVFASFEARTKAKIWIRARNRKLRREGQAKTGSELFFLGLSALGMSPAADEPHRLRGALILQSWWRGALLRLELKRRRVEVEPTSSFFAERAALLTSYEEADWGLLGKMPEVPEEETPQWPVYVGSVASSISDFASYLWSSSPSEDCYAGTSVPRIAVPELRTVSTGKRRVRILFSDTGGGHRASALAMEAALLRQFPVEVTLVDFFREATPWPFCQAPEVYSVMGSLPSLYKKAYEHEHMSCNWRESSSFKLLWSRSRETVLRFMTKTVQEGVDLVLSVHPLVNHLVMEALQEIFPDRWVVPVVTVITDLGTAHPSWFDPRVDLVFVPSPEIEELARRCGVDRVKLHLCGLPVREGFWQPELRSKSELRQLLGLAPEGPGVVLLMGGGEGFGRLLEVATAVGDRLAATGRGQLVVICGRNEEVRQCLDQWAWPEGFRPRVLGFAANVHEYMAAADLLLTKAGPGCIAEAMIKGLPCLVTYFFPGQEEGNVAFVTGAGVGAFVADSRPSEVAETVLSWLQDPALLAQMSAKARGLARPEAALDIAKRICGGLLDLQPS